MIQESFMYLALLMFLAAVLVSLPKLCKGPIAQKVFQFFSPITMIYLGLMLLCTLGVWDLKSTAPAYSALKNPLLYAMLFLMLLRCDLKKIVKLGPKMLLGFFAANISIGAGFVGSYVIFRKLLGADAWKALGALCGSWMGGGGNMLAIQAALDVSEETMAYALVMDSLCGSVYIVFLLWAIGFADKFNRWTKADTRLINEVGEALEAEVRANDRPFLWQNLLVLLGSSFFVSAVAQKAGRWVSGILPFFDKATWTVLVVSAAGILLAMTPFGKLKGTEEVSNVMLYIVVALIASRADLTAVDNAHIWLSVGFLILLLHVVVMVLLAKVFHIDLFTCAVASLANVGGTASAPVLAASYSSALVPVGILMALLGYIVGTGGGLVAAQLMHLFAV